MKRDSGRTRWLLAAALPLALWSAVPGIHWCPLGWSDVSEHLADCLSSAAILNVGTPGCCERSCQHARADRCRAEGMASCPLGRTCAASSCDRAAAPDPGSHAG